MLSGFRNELTFVPCAHSCRPAQWDVSFWAERLKEAKYSIEEEQLRPYFALPNVLQVGPGRGCRQRVVVQKGMGSCGVNSGHAVHALEVQLSCPTGVQGPPQTVVHRR